MIRPSAIKTEPQHYNDSHHFSQIKNHHSPLEGESASQGQSPPASRWGAGPRPQEKTPPLSKNPPPTPPTTQRSLPHHSPLEGESASQGQSPPASRWGVLPAAGPKRNTPLRERAVKPSSNPSPDRRTPNNVSLLIITSPSRTPAVSQFKHVPHPSPLPEGEGRPDEPLPQWERDWGEGVRPQPAAMNPLENFQAETRPVHCTQ